MTHIFEIPIPDLPIQNTTYVVATMTILHLKDAAHGRMLPLVIFGGKFQSVLGAKIDVWGQ